MNECTQRRGASIRRRIFGIFCLLGAIGGISLFSIAGGNDSSPAEVPLAHSTANVGHPTFLSPHARPIAIHGGRVFVVNTPAGTLDVIDASARSVVARVRVGVDPVGLAVRPDGKEVWVANHISDSVSVIDTDAQSPSYLQVVATIQEFDRSTKATRFDEPVGVAFAGNDKAYVALSSENKIAVVDVATREVKKRLDIPAQDPRAIVVRGDRLYVIPFESGNQTQLSGGRRPFDGELVTFDAWEHAVTNNNVLSIGAVMDIVKHPDVPDRDLFVFDTTTDELVEVVDTLGTLLYGLAVDSAGRVFITQTDARNDANGRSGTEGHGLAEMENRAFLNQITAVSPTGETEFFDLEHLPPEHPAPGAALATPFAVQISDDDSTLVASTAGSDVIFTVDAVTGQVLGRCRVGAVPRGIALESDADGAASQAWVMNAVANTVSLVDLARRTEPKVLQTVRLEDPTDATLKRGRIAFNTAAASSTGTFSCASCHPDGHTDQLLWVLKTPIVTGGNQIMPRSTMPVRGLRDTAPYHWDGIPGDPYGGNNSANVFGSVQPNSNADDQRTSSRHLVDEALATTMSIEGATETNDESKPGALAAADRDALAEFLLNISYPPAQRRAYTNELSESAERGFELFHITGDLDPAKAAPNVCGDCHRMPNWVSTNTPGTGMDAPTWRGAYDRWLILPQGRLNIIDFDFYHRVAERGAPEREVWQFSWAGRPRFDPVWNMVLEGSTGYSGSYARQVTLNERVAKGSGTVELLRALESSAGEGGVVLRGDGVFLDGKMPGPVSFIFVDGAYVDDDGASFTRDDLVSSASAGQFIGTFTAHLGTNITPGHPQPVLWTFGPIEQQRGQQAFPYLWPGNRTMTISGRALLEGARLFIDGRRIDGLARFDSDRETVEIELATLPSEGIHFLQVQNPDGLFSNDFILQVTADEAVAEVKRRELARHRAAPDDAMSKAIAAGDLQFVKQLMADGAGSNDRTLDGSTLLATAALYGQAEIAAYLIDRGADVSMTNRDGNTPMHVAAFLCEAEVVELLLTNGAPLNKRNGRGERPADVVSGPWNSGLAGFYLGVGDAVGRSIDLQRIEADRPRMARRLRAGNER